jgi:hypothetical protein
LNAPLYLIDFFGKMKLIQLQFRANNGHSQKFLILKNIVEKRKKSKKLLHNFVEKPSFSLSMRAKQLKIAKSTIFFLFIIKMYCYRSKKQKEVEKTQLRKPHINEEHQPCLAMKFKPLFERFGEKVQQILIECISKI